ncbi:MAG: NAD-dependent epimerase/dehydratase family protein [Gammaproteobacteria bacterium]|nr:MAG: NAD-dependent epimerase/dehydratase family protein [Gammaproteobacteria bacterium]
MDKDAKIYVAGHRGLVGSAIVRKLKSLGFENILTATRNELNLVDQKQTYQFCQDHKPEYAYIAAAKVGGIHANDHYAADFIYNNLMIEGNLIHALYEANTKKALFLGSTCIYPKLAKQPLKEEYLLGGPLEETNEWYAVAKIAGIKLCQAYRKQHNADFISAMPTNLYGQGDNFDLETSHVLPALMRKIHEAKINSDEKVIVWGTGVPRREFCHVDDCADACIFLMREYSSGEIVNIGVGLDLSITDLAQLIKEVVGFNGDIEYDTNKPDGTPRKLVDVSKINDLGWQAKIPLREGLEHTYQWFLNNQ